MSSKTDAFVKLGIFFCISLLSFSIGIFAGKKFSDNQHELAILEPKKHNVNSERDIASLPKPTNADTAEARMGAMTDEEIAKLAEEFVADDTVPAHKNSHTAEGFEAPPPAPTSPAPSVPSSAKSEVHHEPSTAAKSVSAGHAPVTTTVPKNEKVEANRIPSSLPKDVAQFSVGKFTVQVASYPQESEAQKMASDLKSKGYSAFYIPANVKGQTYFRVSVGQFATQKEAQSYRSEFLAKSKVESAIVQKISE